VQILATPILSITLLLIIFERIFGVGLFEASKGGDPVLYQKISMNMILMKIRE
jgi:cytochrome c oxidase subunit 1